MTSFLDRPLFLVTFIGAFISILALFVCVYLVEQYFTRHLLNGWPSLIASIWLLGGLTIFCIGLIGIYISKIFLEVKQRSYTIVRDVYRQGIADPPSLPPFAD